jgi:hypothetical protein
MAPKFQKGPDLKRFMVRHSLFFVVEHVVAQTDTGCSRHAFGIDGPMSHNVVVCYVC